LKLNVEAALAQAARLNAILERVGRPTPFLKGLLNLLQAKAAFDVHCLTAAGTDELACELRPSQALADLMAAAGTRDDDLRLVAQALAHPNTSIVADTPMVGESGGGTR